ncbi:PDZ domain-containing protein [bacterium]|nr:PDZ domain-containing protein [bacterium]
MNSPRTLLTLLFGSIIGAAIATCFEGFGVAAVNAEYFSAGESAAVYRELDHGQSPLVETSRILSRIARVVMPSVVHIDSVRVVPSRGRVEETGSGVIMTSSKRPGRYIVTNKHVVNDALPELENISIQLVDGRIIHPTRFWTDQYSDVAVLQIEVEDVEPLRWGDSDSLEIGNIVLACGSPFGLSQSVTMGIISARGRSSLGIGNRSGVLNQDFLQTDAAINPGNSGGPLIDLQGRLVGINTAIASTHGGNEGIGFSIPSNLVQHVVDHLLEYGEVHRAYLGVKLDPEFDFNAAQQLSLDKLRGARVLEIYPNTPAAKARLRFNDVILEFNGVEVIDESHLINMVSLSDVGKMAEVTVWRDNRRLTLMVDLTGRPTR